MFLFPHTVYSPAHTNKHTCKHLQDKLDQSESKCWYKKVISNSSSETNVFIITRYILCLQLIIQIEKHLQGHITNCLKDLIICLNYNHTENTGYFCHNDSKNDQTLMQLAIHLKHLVFVASHPTLVWMFN